jgi:hypothetical protein
MAPIESAGLDTDDAKQTLADLASLSAPSTPPVQESLLAEARAWLSEEWRRIVGEQARREPRKTLPGRLDALHALDGLASIPATSIVRQYTVGWEYLDAVARQDWLAAIMSAARVLWAGSDADAQAILASFSA